MQKPSAQPVQPTPIPAQPTPKAVPVPLPQPSVTYQEEPPTKPQTPSTIQPNNAAPIQPAKPKPELSYKPIPSNPTGIHSPMANPTPNSRVQIPGQEAPGLILRRLSKSPEKLVALTFDDGPSPINTPQVLEILSRYGIRATFFLLGRELHSHPQIAQNIVEAGHAVGNHTWHHRYANAEEAIARAEIEDTKTEIQNTLGVQTNLFRPPGGRLKNGLADYALRSGETVVIWSVQSNDWEARSSEEIVQNVLGAISPGSIVLMHDGGGDRSKTIAALPQIIEALQAEGYRFVTVPEIVELEQNN